MKVGQNLQMLTIPYFRNGIIGFGTFKVSETAAREGRNPRTGEVIQIAAGKAPKFSAGKELKDAVNG